MDPESEFHHRLAKKIAADLAERSTQLANGYAESFEDYRYRAGIIAGLNRVLELCRTVEREMSA